MYCLVSLHRPDHLSDGIVALFFQTGLGILAVVGGLEKVVVQKKVSAGCVGRMVPQMQRNALI